VRIDVPDNFYLRPVEETDHEFLVELHNDPVVLHNLTHPSPITMEQHLRWWEKTKSDRRQLRLVFVAEGQRAGLTKFYDYDAVNQTIVLGADIHKEFRGRGWAKLMWTLMLERCFDGFNVWRRVNTSITAWVSRTRAGSRSRCSVMANATTRSACT
jgi:RimJ/RimL family protein N-acetyltransferase